MTARVSSRDVAPMPAAQLDALEPLHSFITAVELREEHEVAKSLRVTLRNAARELGMQVPR